MTLLFFKSCIGLISQSVNDTRICLLRSCLSHVLYNTVFSEKLLRFLLVVAPCLLDEWDLEVELVDFVCAFRAIGLVNAKRNCINLSYIVQRPSITALHIPKDSTMALICEWSMVSPLRCLSTNFSTACITWSCVFWNMSSLQRTR